MVRLFGKHKKKSDPNKSIDSSIIDHSTMPSYSNRYDDMAHEPPVGGLKQTLQDHHNDYQTLELNDYDSKINHNSGHVDHGSSSAPAKVPANAPVSTPWTRFKLDNSPFPRYRHAASIVSSDKYDVFLMGGLKEGSVFGDTWKISPKVSHHQITGYEANVIDVTNGQTPPARVGHAAVLCGNAFIVYGGDTVDTDNDGFPDNNFYLFNINNHKYTVPSHILSKPSGRYGHTLGVVSLNNSSSRLYLFGGQLENQVYNDLYYFELNTFKSSKAKWELVEPLNNFLPPPLTNHSMITYKSKLYIFGGVYNNEKVSNDLWSFDALINKWTQIPTTGSIPPPTNEHSCCAVHDKLYIYGGNDFSGVIYSSLYVLDLNTFVWSKITTEGEVDGPGPRCGHTMTFIPKYNKVLIMGGDKNDYVSDDPQDFDTYDNFVGNETSTMIYELNTEVIDHFLTEKPPLTRRQSLKKVAASSKKNEIYQQHTKSVSNGPEDFASASTSPELKAIDVQPKTVGDGLKNSYEPEEEDVKPLRRSLDPLASPNHNNTDTIVGAALGAGAGLAVGGAVHEYNQHTPEDAHMPSSTFESHVNRVSAGYNDTVENDEDAGETLPLSQDSRKRGSRGIENPYKAEETASNGKHDDSLAEDSFDKIAPASNGLTRTQTNPENVKQFISELTTQLTTLRSTTKSQMQQASTRIKQLEEENRQIRENADRDGELASLRQQLQERDDVIADLKQSVDPKDLAIDDNATGSSSTVPELGKYKLERMELMNKLLHVQKENETLKQKQEEFEPFMENQIGDLSKFQKIIQAQEEKLETLSNQLLDQQDLTKELNDWKVKHQNLEMEFKNYKTIHEDDVISDDEGDDSFAPPHSRDISGVSNDNRSIMSNARTKKDIGGQLENLVNAWKSRQTAAAAAGDQEKSLDGANSDEHQKVIQQLQSQVDNLLKISKENEVNSSTEISTLRKELEDRLANLKSIEEKYNDALQSVNNTSKALKLNQEESESQKLLLEKLIKENNELKLFKKASKKAGSRNATPLLEGEGQFPATIEEGENEDDDVLSNAHFNMKLKDLEADLYIVKQERDQLKQNVTNLQKQLYLATQNE